MKRFWTFTICLIAFVGHSQQWVVSYPMDNGVVLVGGDCNGAGNYIVGACNNVDGSGYLDGYAMFVTNDGDYVEKIFSYEGYKSHLCNAICLDNGNAFVVGVKGGTLTNHEYDTLWISIMNPELDIIEEHDYPLVEPYKTWTTDVYLDFNNNGEIMLLADVSEYNYPNMTNGVYAVFKCDSDGNMLNSRYLREGHGINGARPSGIIRVPDSDNMLMIGRGFYVNNCHSLCYIDNELNIVDTYPIPWLEDNRNYTDCWKDNGHFLMSSMTHHQGAYGNSYYVAVFEVDYEGHYVDTLVYDRADTSDYTAQFGSMAYVSDDAIYIATYWENLQNELPSDAVICLIDSDLNLKGTKRLKVENTKVRLMHCQKTSDGGCLVYGQCKESYGSEKVYVWKLLPEDFVNITNITDNPEVLPHQSVYPNPVEGYFNLDLSCHDCKHIRVTITDLIGRKRLERQFYNSDGQLTVDVSSLERGHYLYNVEIKGNTKQKGKFIKK